MRITRTRLTGLLRMGVTLGIDSTHFGPDLACTRAQFVTFLWRAAGSPEPVNNANTFTDVDPVEHSGYYKAILWASEQGITSGTGAGEFSPDGVVTRAQSVTFMYRYAQKTGDIGAVGSSTFDDVRNEGEMANYYEAIGWAVANGITAGNSTVENTFGPTDDCIRAQMITFLHRYFAS